MNGTIQRWGRRNPIIGRIRAKGWRIRSESETLGPVLLFADDEGIRNIFVFLGVGWVPPEVGVKFCILYTWISF